VPEAPFGHDTFTNGEESDGLGSGRSIMVPVALVIPFFSKHVVCVAISLFQDKSFALQ
jgi:hypothetical protein